MDNFTQEIIKLAKASDGTKRDALCAWAYTPAEFPTLNAYVRDGITSLEAILVRAAQVA
jgi:hypothetical protein